MTDSFDNLIENKDADPGAPETETRAPGRRKRRWLAAILVLCVLIILVSAAAVWGYVLTVSARSLPNVYVDGIPVGAMTKTEIAAALDAADWAAREDERLRVTLPAGAAFTVDYIRSGAILGREQAVEEAFASGRTGGVFGTLWQALRRRFESVDVTQGERTLDEAYIRSCVQEGEKALQKRLAGKPWQADTGRGRLSVLKGAGGVELDTQALAGQIAAALRRGDTALSFEQLKSQPKEPDFEALLAELAVEPEDAYFTEDFEIVPEVVGCRFDAAEARRLWQSAKTGEQVQIPLELLRPETTAESLNAMLYRDLLGSQTTSYAWSTENRINNINLVAQKLDGHILLPGEVFSYNDYVGQRTEEAGFRLAGAYNDGQVVEAIGGGICQVSSTLYCAEMYAQLETVSRTNHYFKVNYLDYGLDATVSWGQPDFKFRNCRDYPVKIAAYLNSDDQTLTIELWGTDVDGSYIKLRTTSAEVYDTEYPDVLIGYTIRTYRDIYDAEGDYLDTQYENAGVYYFHDEDIEWPDGHEAGGFDLFLDSQYLNPT